MSSLHCRSMRDVVEFAISREEKARDFYHHCANHVRNEAIRDFFRDMAEEEERHRSLLAALDLNGEKPFSDLKGEGRIQDLHLSDFMVDVRFTPDINYQEALAMAMKKEEKAHAFYGAWKNRCANARTEKLFSFLAEEELRHKRGIEELYDSDILQQG